MQPKIKPEDSNKKEQMHKQKKIESDILYDNEVISKEMERKIEESNADSDPVISKLKTKYSKRLSKAVIAQLREITFNNSGTCNVKLILSKSGMVLRHYVSNCTGEKEFQHEVSKKIRSVITQLPKPPEKIFDIARNVEFKVAG